jgi:predicted Zn-dependent protease
MEGVTRKILIFAVVMALVAAGGWFGRKAYKRMAERRMIRQAQTYLEKRDWRNAGLCLQRAIQINPMSATAADRMADFLESQGSPAGLTWRMRAAQLDEASPGYRLAWAKTAIQLRDLEGARGALDGLGEKDKHTADYHKLAGALAWARSNAEEAERHYQQALQLEPANPAAAMNLATIHLSSTNAAVAESGRLALERVSTNASLRLAALRMLATAEVSRHSLAAAADYARRIVESPDSTFADRLEYLRVLHAAASPELAANLASVEREAATNAVRAFSVGLWLGRAQGTTNALRWLNSLPESTRTNQPVPVLIAECLSMLSDWKAVLALIGKADWGEAEYYRLALEALAQKSMRQDLAAKAAWQKAARLSSRRLDRASRLARLSAAWGWKSETTDLLRQITSDFPKEKWAARLLVLEYYENGNSRALADLLVKTHAANPADPQLMNNLANISLLRGTDLPRAHALAREAYETAPENPFFASTYAYSLLLQEKPGDAARIVGGIKTNYLRIPSVAAYYGVVRARSGGGELAKDSLELAGKARLLPEEKEMVRQALGKL